jgi:hypothetical protein
MGPSQAGRTSGRNHVSGIARHYAVSPHVDEGRGFPARRVSVVDFGESSHRESMTREPRSRRRRLEFGEHGSNRKPDDETRSFCAFR